MSESQPQLSIPAEAAWGATFDAGRATDAYIANGVATFTGARFVRAVADELMAAYRREGEAMAKREQTIKMAEANKAFSHFAW